MTKVPLAFLGLGLSAPELALAHELTTQYGLVLGPALHVFTEIDHLAAFAAVGLLVGQQEAAQSRYNALFAFLAALVVGMSLPFLVTGVGAFEAVEREFSAASTLAIGILVAVAARAWVGVIAISAATLGAVHGVANGLAIAGSPAPAASIFGAAAAALLTAATAIVIVRALHGKVKYGGIAVRVLGSWIAALALMLLGLALRA